MMRSFKKKIKSDLGNGSHSITGANPDVTTQEIPDVAPRQILMVPLMQILMMLNSQKSQMTLVEPLIGMILKMMLVLLRLT